MNNEQHILVIDDDDDIGLMLKMLLEFKGYRVTVLTRADKIMSVLEKSTFDLLILDMLIAGENGCDVCRMLKADPAFSHLPILLFSALPAARALAMEAGADNFIAKPFEMKAMHEKLVSMLAKK